MLTFRPVKVKPTTLRWSPYLCTIPGFGLIRMRRVTSSALLRGSCLVPAAHPRAPSTVKSSDDRLFITVNDYRPEYATSGATLLLTHSTSFCKELWEPLIEFWLREGSPLRISVVFGLDAVNHDDSVVVNESRLGSSSECTVFSCLRASVSSPAALPVYPKICNDGEWCIYIYDTDSIYILAYWPDHSRDILKVIDRLGATRPLIGIRHSFGGSTL